MRIERPALTKTQHSAYNIASAQCMLTIIINIIHEGRNLLFLIIVVSPMPGTLSVLNK